MKNNIFAVVDNTTNKVVFYYNKEEANAAVAVLAKIGVKASIKVL